ncbi:MAG: YdeI/OmpD-associated family protein [Oscillospiraceae bacterium]|nr:YdeI/OmpD-associated family protein [Oscillospiraceae bacterium]
MEENNFIGIGHNPGGPDLPLGLGMQLAQDPQAMDAFGKLTKQQKTDMISYIQQSVTGEDAENRIISAVNRLRDEQTWQPGFRI